MIKVIIWEACGAIVVFGRWFHSTLRIMFSLEKPLPVSINNLRTQSLTEVSRAEPELSQKNIPSLLIEASWKEGGDKGETVTKKREERIILVKAGEREKNSKNFKKDMFFIIFHFVKLFSHLRNRHSTAVVVPQLLTCRNRLFTHKSMCTNHKKNCLFKHNRLERAVAS